MLSFAAATYVVPPFCAFNGTDNLTVCCDNQTASVGNLTTNATTANHVCYTFVEINAYIAANETALCNEIMTEVTDCTGSSLGQSVCMSNAILTFFEDANLLNIYGWLYFDKGSEA